jgi:hypothetical protein
MAELSWVGEGSELLYIGGLIVEGRFETGCAGSKQVGMEGFASSGRFNCAGRKEYTERECEGERAV